MTPAPEIPPGMNVFGDLAAALILLLVGIALTGWAYETKFWAVRLTAGTLGMALICVFAYRAFEDGWPTTAWSVWIASVSVIFALGWTVIAQVLRRARD